MSRPYVPLNVHTHYSLLDGATRIPDLLRIAQENAMPAVAITDNGVMYGALELYTQAKAAGIKPIIGCTVYVMDGDITERGVRKPHHHLVLLAKNYTGYQNLIRLVSIGQLEGFYYKPRINWELLRAHSQGLIALTSGQSGPIAQPILRGNPDEARQRARDLKDIFGADLFLELQDHGKESEQLTGAGLVEIGRELDIPWVITNDSRYSYPHQSTMHDIVLCLQNGKTLDDPSRMQPYGPEYYIKTGDQLLQSFQHLDRALVLEALDRTLEVAERCDLSLKLGESILPEFPLPPGVSADEALRQTVMEHARRKLGDISGQAQARLDYELGIISQMGFPAYFLIVWDFINFARQEGIPVGPGRGSAAGSLVAYTLGITNIDPLEHNLLFERFLNPERISMPDIDIDFCIERRDEVIRYVTERYGQDRVCQIGTFGTLAARAALKAVARVMNLPFAESDRLAKMIPGMPGTKLEDALKDGQELKKLYDTDAKVKELVDLALSIEGNAFNVGTHAAGVVISKDPLVQVVPLQHSKDGQMISQYPMGDLEKLGLLKMDFLGLRNLTIIHNTVKLIETKLLETKQSSEKQDSPQQQQQTQQKTQQQAGPAKLVMDELPLDDAAVYETLTRGDTDGVFQLESSGMKALVKDLKPSTFEDINALVALFRPGPLNSGMVKDFVNRKHGREKVTYKHPDLEPILKDTYGTIVYQEQIMQIAQTLAGYSLGQADLLRRAMGKKKAEVMAKEENNFVTGATNNGVDEALAKELFAAMTEFAAYCFNRSHSAAYAMVAYQTAYLKTHYPVEYLSALLSSVQNDLDKIQHYILTARRAGIAILPPDVNKSGLEFTPDAQAIRFGLASVKHVGQSSVEAILAARAAGTSEGTSLEPFTSLEDFLKRVDPKVLNRKTLESLIQCGALASFGHSRKQLMDNLETLLQFAARSQEQKLTGQVSLFASSAAAEGDFASLMLSGNPADEYPDDEIQQREKTLLGFYVSSHPLDSIVETLPSMVSHLIAELKELPDQSEVTVGGLIASLQKKLTKSNKPLWVLQLEDISSSVECVLFNDAINRLEQKSLGQQHDGKALEALDTMLQEGKKVLVTGKLQFRGDEAQTASVVVNDLRPMERVKPMTLAFNNLPRFEDVAYLGQLLAAHRGMNPVILMFPDGSRIKAGSSFWVTDPEGRSPLEARLQAHFGEQLQIV